jgi:hypothetical protein
MVATDLPKTTKIQGMLVVNQKPSMETTVNGWHFRVPDSWLTGDARDWKKLEVKKHQLVRSLGHLPEFRPVCPTTESDRGKMIVAAGICGLFRNKSPLQPPPRLLYERKTSR